MRYFLCLFLFIQLSCFKQTEYSSTIAITADSIYCYNKAVISLQELHIDSLKDIDYSNSKIKTRLKVIDSIFYEAQKRDSSFEKALAKQKFSSEKERRIWYNQNKPKGRNYRSKSDPSFHSTPDYSPWYDWIGRYERASIKAYKNVDWGILNKILLTLTNHGYGTFDFYAHVSLQPEINDITFSNRDIFMLTQQSYDIEEDQLTLY